MNGQVKGQAPARAAGAGAAVTAVPKAGTPLPSGAASGTLGQPWHCCGEAPAQIPSGERGHGGTFCRCTPTECSKPPILIRAVPHFSALAAGFASLPSCCCTHSPLTGFPAACMDPTLPGLHPQALPALPGKESTASLLPC